MTAHDVIAVLGRWLRVGDQESVNVLADMCVQAGDEEAAKLLTEGSPVLMVTDDERAVARCISFQEVEEGGYVEKRMVAGGIVARRAFATGVAYGLRHDEAVAGEPSQVRRIIECRIAERLAEDRRIDDEIMAATGGMECGRCGKDDCDGVFVEEGGGCKP